MDVGNDLVAMSHIKSIGIGLARVGKIMLLRTGHHCMQAEGHKAQSTKAAQALGLADQLARQRGMYQLTGRMA